jgi:hypothetical protein
MIKKSKLKNPAGAKKKMNKETALQTGRHLTRHRRRIQKAKPKVIK